MLIILISLPLTPFAWRTAVSLIGTGFNQIGYIITAVVLISFLTLMLRFWRRYGFLRIALFTGIGLIYAFLLKYHCKFPAEKLHLIEYGFLAFLAYEAFLIDFSQEASQGLAFVGASGFGLLDEILQFFLPNRAFEVRDVITNILAAALGMIIVTLLTTSFSAKVPSER
jgi:glycopeptide antibiotics resistance protein